MIKVGDFVVSCATFAGALFIGVGGLGALANHIAAAGDPHMHVAHAGVSVSRTEDAVYFYDGGDNTATIKTDDGNMWLLSNPNITHDCVVSVSFDDCGTTAVKDDKIVDYHEY